MLGKANSFCEVGSISTRYNLIVPPVCKVCVFCIHESVKLRLSPGRVGPGIKISLDIVARISSGKIGVASRDDVLQYQLRPLALGKNTTPAFSSSLSRFFVRKNEVKIS